MGGLGVGYGSFLVGSWDAGCVSWGKGGKEEEGRGGEGAVGRNILDGFYESCHAGFAYVIGSLDTDGVD